jgi:hypothetical protein
MFEESDCMAIEEYLIVSTNCYESLGGPVAICRRDAYRGEDQIY